jgi:hypothetical protein
MAFLSQIFEFKIWHLLLAIIFIYLILTYLNYTIIFSDSFFYTVYGNQLDLPQIEKIIGTTRKYLFLSVSLIPIMILLKFYILSLVLYTGIFFSNKIIKFNDCLRIVLIGEFIPIIVSIITFINFSLTPVRTINEFQSFSPLSFTQLLNLKEIPTYIIYPIRLLNLFEIFYWLILIAGVSYFLKDSFKKSFFLIASSYGVALVIWVLFVMFIQIQFS